MKRLIYTSAALFTIALGLQNPFVQSSASASVVGTSLTVALSPAAGPPITSAANLDKAGLWQGGTHMHMVDWGVYTTAAGTANELSGGPSVFGNIGVVGNGQIAGNKNSWTLSYTNPTNANPPSGSTFGANTTYNFGGGAGGQTLTVTPNIALGKRGSVRIYGDLDMGGTFAQTIAQATYTVGGGFAQQLNLTGGNNPGNLAQQATYVYEIFFDNYQGESFTFGVTTTYLAPAPQQSIAAVQVSQVPEPGTFALLPVAGMLAWCVRRRRRTTR